MGYFQDHPITGERLGPDALSASQATIDRWDCPSLFRAEAQASVVVFECSGAAAMDPPGGSFRGFGSIGRGSGAIVIALMCRVGRRI